MPKYEYVINVRLADIQIDLYKAYLNKVGRGVCSDALEGRFKQGFGLRQRIKAFPPPPHFVYHNGGADALDNLPFC